MLNEVPPAGSQAYDFAFDKREVDAIFGDLVVDDKPGGAVGIAVGGKTIYRAYFGLADLCHRRRVAETTKFRVGAISNQITALAFMLLCEDGQAKLDSPIIEYLPNLTRSARYVTPRHLLTQTAGLRDAFDIIWQFSGPKTHVSARELISLYDRFIDSNSVPGEAWTYNNGSYLLITALLERLTNQPLEDILSQRIFRPLGMHDSHLVRHDCDLPNDAAVGYSRKCDGSYFEASSGTASSGEGGVISTIDDLLLWQRNFDRHFVGSAETWREITSVQRLNNGTSTDYGLGIMFDNYRELPVVSHVAGCWGGSAEVLKAPTLSLDVVVVTNRSDVWAGERAERILDACVSGLSERKLAQEVRPVKGVYVSATSNRVVQLNTRKPLEVYIDGVGIPALVDENGCLVSAGVCKYLRQKITLEDNCDDLIELSELGNSERFIRLNPPPVDEDPRADGIYTSVETKTVAIISNHAKCMTVAGFAGENEFEMQRLGDDIWQAKSRHGEFGGGMLLFSVSRGSFSFSNQRTRSLAFERCGYRTKAAEYTEDRVGDGHE